MVSRIAGSIHGLCLGRAHAKLDSDRQTLHLRDTPKNNSVHTTFQNPLQSHRNTSTTEKTHTDNPPFPLIRLSLVITVASILRTVQYTKYTHHLHNTQIYHPSLTPVRGKNAHDLPPHYLPHLIRERKTHPPHQLQTKTRKKDRNINPETRKMLWT